MFVEARQLDKRCWVEVNIAQLKANYLAYKASLHRNAEIMAVIKADAYGHGDYQVARLLSDCGVKFFAVSNIDEAMTLREAGINGEILILGYTAIEHSRTLFQNHLTQAIVSEEYARALAETDYRVKCQFAIDTGMNRIGLDADDSAACEGVIRHFVGKLDVNGMFTHLCVADCDNDDCKNFTLGQINKFKTVVDSVADLGFPYCHCCNSAAGLRYLESSALYSGIGNIVRLGIILYGLKPDVSSVLPANIRPALSWRSRVALVKKVSKGETIGYGRTYCAQSDCRIATLTVGYADGYSRQLSNRGFVLVNGRRAPIVGRVCMDQTMVDVTSVPDVKMGDEVVLLGCSGEEEYSADDMAQDLRTIGYEILCNISKRVQRFYINDGAK